MLSSQDCSNKNDIVSSCQWGLWELSSYCCQGDRHTLHYYGPHLFHSFILCCLMEGGFMEGKKTLCCAGTLVMDQIALDIFVILVVWLIMAVGCTQRARNNHLMGLLDEILLQTLNWQIRKKAHTNKQTFSKS